MMTIDTPIAMYVVVGSALVGGVTAWVGEGETGCTGVDVGGTTGVAVGGACVGVGMTAGAAAVSSTPKAVLADDG